MAMTDSTAPRPGGAGRLAGKVALVFGAGCVGPGWGNGNATAVTFAREGAVVIAVDRDAGAAEATRHLIAEEGGECDALAADATRSEDVARVVATVVDRRGRVDVLHNNVGYATMGGPVELSEDDWQRTLDLNVKTVFLACKYAIPVMLRQGKGAIVNISSIA